ncbi:MAG: DUF4167 domain-containing protein [Rhodospirillaceae bacterium]|nr:DUF4167 domain-containing protein [Rhodospirillaceae bacterium]
MKQASNSRRSRGRGNGKRQSNRNSNFDSGGPEGRIRGNASQVHEKYLALARDALSADDRVASENYFQHAEHFYRILHANSENQKDGAKDGTKDDDANQKDRGRNRRGRNRGNGRDNARDNNNNQRQNAEAENTETKPDIAESVEVAATEPVENPGNSIEDVPEPQEPEAPQEGEEPQKPQEPQDPISA